MKTQIKWVERKDVELLDGYVGDSRAAMFAIWTWGNGDSARLWINLPFTSPLPCSSIEAGKSEAERLLLLLQEAMGRATQ